MPIWIADYVLASYGTGAVMAVPGHDERDFEFAKTFGLPVKEVVKGGNIEEAAYTGDGEHVNSDFLNGLNKQEAIEKVIAWLEETKNGEKESDVPSARLALQPPALLGRTDSGHSLGRRNINGCAGRGAAADFAENG